MIISYFECGDTGDFEDLAAWPSCLWPTCSTDTLPLANATGELREHVKKHVLIVVEAGEGAILRFCLQTDLCYYFCRNKKWFKVFATGLN